MENKSKLYLDHHHNCINDYTDYYRYTCKPHLNISNYIDILPYYYKEYI